MISHVLKCLTHCHSYLIITVQLIYNLMVHIFASGFVIIHRKTLVTAIAKATILQLQHLTSLEFSVDIHTNSILFRMQKMFYCTLNPPHKYIFLKSSVWRNAAFLSFNVIVPLWPIRILIRMLCRHKVNISKY